MGLPRLSIARTGPKIKGVPVNMSSFVFAFCVFHTSCNACYIGLLSDILQVVLESVNRISL